MLLFLFIVVGSESSFDMRSSFRMDSPSDWILPFLVENTIYQLFIIYITDSVSNGNANKFTRTNSIVFCLQAEHLRYGIIAT